MDRQRTINVNRAYGNTGNIYNYGENTELQNLQQHHLWDQQVALNYMCESSAADQYITMHPAVINNPGPNGKGIEEILLSVNRRYM